MLPSEPLILLVDGNNLAHFLYTNLNPGQKMTRADSQRLVEHLDSYSRSYAGILQVELCLDRSPGDPEIASGMQVFHAEYPQTADDLLLGRFWFHRLAQRPCLVITNDEAILEEVSEAQGNGMRVYDFVRRPGLTAPVFRAPDELPGAALPAPVDPKINPTLSLSASIYFRIVKEDQARSKTAMQNRDTGSKPAARSEPALEAGPETPPLPEAVLAASERVAPPEPASPADALPMENPGNPQHPLALPEDKQSVEGPYYFLSLDTWPLAEGARFLLNAFCPRHLAEYRDLVGTLNFSALQPADLRALAELLLHTCGNEPEFATQGALMARVRLALLQARGEPLSIEQLAERTGLKRHGLQGRIKEKAGRWIEILHP